MRRIHAPHRLALLFPMLVLPLRASAQTTGGDAAQPRSSSADWSNGLAIVAIVLLFFIGIGVAVKLYDVKRRRTEENAALQSLLSEALLLEGSLTRLPIAAFVSRSVWPRSPLVVTVRGSVPTPELRGTVMQLVELEAVRRHPGARVEDRLMIDPLVGQDRVRSTAR